jgi:hypothetical protein
MLVLELRRPAWSAPKTLPSAGYFRGYRLRAMLTAPLDPPSELCHLHDTLARPSPGSPHDIAEPYREGNRGRCRDIGADESYRVAGMTPLLARRLREDAVREAAWVARCVGQAETSPLSESDLSALAAYLSGRQFDRGAVLYAAGKVPDGVWIIREGVAEPREVPRPDQSWGGPGPAP